MKRYICDRCKEWEELSEVSGLCQGCIDIIGIKLVSKLEVLIAYKSMTELSSKHTPVPHRFYKLKPIWSYLKLRVSKLLG